MKLVYVSHPYTKDPDRNFSDAEVKVARWMDEFRDVCFVNPLALFNGLTRRNAEILACCLEVVARCDEVLLCDGWEDSVGCRAEYAEAVRCG